QVAERLATYTAPTFQGALANGVSVLRRRRYSRLPLLDAILNRLDLADDLSRQIQRAGLPVRAGEFVFIQIVLATFCALLGAILAWDFLNGPIGALVGLVIGFAAPLIWLRIRAERRQDAFEQGLPDALDRVTGALGAGY